MPERRARNGRHDVIGHRRMDRIEQPKRGDRRALAAGRFGHEIEPSHLRSVLSLEIESVYYLLRAVLPGMRQRRRGHIVKDLGPTHAKLLQRLLRRRLGRPPGSLMRCGAPSCIRATATAPAASPENSSVRWSG